MVWTYLSTGVTVPLHFARLIMPPFHKTCSPCGTWPCSPARFALRSAGPTRSARTLKTNDTLHSQTKLHASATFTYLLSLPELTAIGGGIVVLDDRATSVLPVGNADPEEPTVSFLTPEAPVAARVGLTQTAHAQFAHWGR